MAFIRLNPLVTLVGGGVWGLSSECDGNVYLVATGGEAALVDAGTGIDPGRIVDNVRQAGVDRLRYIFLTHAHADHAGGAGAIREALGGEVLAAEPDATLVESGDDEALGLSAARRSGIYPARYRFPHTRVDTRVADGVTYPLGGLTVQAITVPSHSPGSVCYLLDAGAGGGRQLFSGDVVFVGGRVSIINAPGCELAAYRNHIAKLAGLDVQALFPGHLVVRLTGAQRHVSAAVNAFQGSRLPPTLVSLSIPEHPDSTPEPPSGQRVLRSGRARG